MDALNFAEQSISPYEYTVEGRLTRLVGLTIEAQGCQVNIGGRCLIVSPNEQKLEAEVVGFSGTKSYLMPIEKMQGAVLGARVIPTKDNHRLPVGQELLGRVVDSAGRPLDKKGPVQASEFRDLEGKNINPFERMPIEAPLDVGVKAINALLSIGTGQRMGLFAGSGVGKSVLLGMMTKFTSADVIVVGLIGERGREVKEFIDQILGQMGLAKTVVVAAPADCSPLQRVHAAKYATTIAEFFRDEGKQVLLLMDSLTRVAQSYREIALAIGEPPATKGYPPSVFTKIPALVERAGNSSILGGSITAFYTVLVEGDDQNDPIADASRAILDGHITLSRSLAEAGHFPAIDVEASISRLFHTVCGAEQIELAQKFRELYGRYKKHEDMINLGVYQFGTDETIDQAIEFYPQLQKFLKQNMQQSYNYQQSVHDLGAALMPPQTQIDP
ncbi:MAG: flagellar protein export ATPase FliI [Pseudomonadota bacterium]